MDALEFLLNAQRYCNSDDETVVKLKGIFLEKGLSTFDFETMVDAVENGHENILSRRGSLSS